MKSLKLGDNSLWIQIVPAPKDAKDTTNVKNAPNIMQQKANYPFAREQKAQCLTS